MKKTTMLTLALAVLARAASAQAVDLADSAFYARLNFDDSWTRSLPDPGNTAWLVLDPASSDFPRELRDLPIPGAPPAGSRSAFPRLWVDYTVLLPFDADLTLLNMSDPALYLAHVGQAWSVYLNGVLIRSEMRAGAGGKPIERSLRGAIVPLDKRRLRRGENILAFHLRGDPMDDRTGFNLTGPYVIDSYRALRAGNREYVDIMLIGIYAFFAAYHCLLFLLRRNERGYLYFGLAALSLAMYLATRTTAAASVVIDTSVLKRIEYTSLFLIVPCFIAFLESLLSGKVSRWTKMLAVTCLAIVALCFVFRQEPFLFAWYGLTALAIVGYLALMLVPALARDFRRLLAARTGPRRALGALASMIPRTDSGKMAIGTVLIMATTIIDIIQLQSGRSTLLSWYAFFVFLLGAAGVLAAQFTAVYAGLETMTLGLEQTIHERTAELAEAADERLRLNADLAGANKALKGTMYIAERDMSIAVSVQKGMFPARPPETEDWDLAFVSEPAAGVSGDVYDFYAKDGRLWGLLVGEVSGGGISSGLITLLARNVFFRRSVNRDAEPLGAVMADINKELVRELSSVDNHLTCAFLRLGGDRVEYANASHPDALFRKAGRGTVMALKPKDGAGHKAPAFGRAPLDSGVKALSFAMSRGDAVLAYSDGLTDSRNAKGEPYGIERLTKAFGRADPENAESLLVSVMIDFRNFTAGARRDDDLTAVVLFRK